jgi:hypothetical protein
LVQHFCTSAEPYTVNHLVDIRFWAYSGSFIAFGTFGSPLILFGSLLFPLGRHPVPFESLFGFQLGLVFEQPF